jgi:hypothetical protein
LVRLERLEFGGDHVGWVLHADADSRVGERPVAVHLGNAHVEIPVGDVGAVTSVNDPVQAQEPVGRGYDHWSVYTIEIEARIVPARTPRAVHGLQLSGQSRRQRDDRSRVEIGILPSIQSRSDARGERIIHRGVAEGASRADPNKGVAAFCSRFDGALQSHNGIQLEKRYRGCRISQADRAALDTLYYLRRQRVGIDFETHLQRCGWIYGRLNDFVHPEGVGPERFVPIGVEAEDLSPLFYQGWIRWLRTARSIVPTGDHHRSCTAP